MPVQKFRARMKTPKYNPEEDPEFVDEFGEYFTKAAYEEEGEWWESDGEWWGLMGGNGG